MDVPRSRNTLQLWEERLQRRSVEDPARASSHTLEQSERELRLLAKQAAEGVSFDPDRRELGRGDHGRRPALAVQASELSNEVTRSELGLSAGGDDLALEHLRLAIDDHVERSSRRVLLHDDPAGVGCGLFGEGGDPTQMRAGESLEEGNSADQLDLRTARRHAGISPGDGAA